LIGTPDYIAPEIVHQTSLNNFTIDWWSLGVMAYEIMIGNRPFGGETIDQVINNITMFNIDWPETGYEEGMITPEAKDFIEKLLNKDFTQRLGANGA
jgi:serine/threonine protein kinase